MSSAVITREEEVQRFFAYARERHAIYLRRAEGRPRPWTKETTMARFSITNVYRELDRTTIWMKKHVRDAQMDPVHILPAIVLARWFNLIRSGETLFCEPNMFPPGLNTSQVRSEGFTPWDDWLLTEDLRVLEYPLRKQGSPWVTGAYMIRSPVGMDKLEGVLSSFRNFWTSRPKFEVNNGTLVSMGWRDVAQYCLDARDGPNPTSLRRVWAWLTNFFGLGPFLAYEVVTDLRHTPLLDRAPDIDTWANPGPGALRGANLIIRGAIQGRKDRLEKASYAEAHSVMAYLLECSRDPRYWPQPSTAGDFVVGDPAWTTRASEVGDLGDLEIPASMTSERWPRWEMREPEMFLCEYAKLERTRLGFGRPRGNYPK